MTQQILSRDAIRRQARAAVDAKRPITDCPYLQGTSSAKKYVAEYLMRELEVNDAKPVVSTFAYGAVEQLEEVR